MIIDSLKNCQTYLGMHPRFAKAFDYLLKTDLASLPDGRHEIDGDEIYLMMARRELKKPEEALMEVHDRYIDIQLVIRGRETFGWSDRAELKTPRGNIDREKDILFFDDAPATLYTVHDGQMSIFFPGDGHAPMIGEGGIVKCIVKVLV
jgi:YhcH/YjgK/YiaL family protein